MEIKRDVYIVAYTKEKGKMELSKDEWKESLYCFTYNFHRIDGPALKLAQFFHEKFFIDNKEYQKIEYDSIIQEVKNMSVAERLTDARWWVREFRE